MLIVAQRPLEVLRPAEDLSSQMPGNISTEHRATAGYRRK